MRAGGAVDVDWMRLQITRDMSDAIRQQRFSSGVE